MAVEWRGERCIKCGACVGVCPFGAIRLEGTHRIVVDPEKCTNCGLCVKACPVGALKLEFKVRK